MANNFEWEAEDGTAFDEEELQQEFHAERPPRLRRPLFFLVALALLLLLGVVAFRRLGQRVTNAAEDVEEAIQSSHALVTSAARSGDLEVLANVLSGRQLDWTDAQLDLVRENLLYDRRPLGLEWQPMESFEGIETSISPDLQVAEVVSLQSYLVQGDPNNAVSLQQTSVYRRSGNRWLLSPPPFGFWGEKVSTRGHFLQLNVLKRDESLGLRIAADLEATIGAACASLSDLECQDETRLEVNLIADPTLLLDLEPAESRLQGSRYLSLPTPTLVGLPVDESGYRALYRGYAERVVSALIGDLVDWPCCQRAHFYQALLDAQLFQLGLNRWRLGREDYRLMAEHPFGMDELRRLWTQDGDPTEALDERETALVYAFVEFITAHPNSSSPAQMQRSLSSSPTFDDWLVQLSEDGATVEESWNRHIYTQIDDAGRGE